MRNEGAKYIKQLEDIISKFLEPIKNIPYRLAIKALTGCEVLKFDLALKENKELIELPKRSAKIAGENARESGIQAKRPNETGNKIEPFVIDALKKVGLSADKPKTKSGRKKVSRYPDIEISYNGKTIYLDCKTYSEITKQQSFRTFYFSPSKDPKIVKDAYHLLLSYELKQVTKNKKQVYIPVSWQLYTLENLSVQIKHEFNASNKDIYRKDFLLAEGRF
ncbi:MAG: restriction endonuclease [Candidatus Kryptonium sp.]|nr:restriction endonuclease [Candidatus Kryptonium sp.]